MYKKNEIFLLFALTAPNATEESKGQAISPLCDILAFSVFILLLGVVFSFVCFASGTEGAFVYKPNRSHRKLTQDSSLSFPESGWLLIQDEFLLPSTASMGEMPICQKQRHALLSYLHHHVLILCGHRSLRYFIIQLPPVPPHI